MNIVSVNGIDLAYNRRGKGTPLMLVHGFPLDSSSWNEIVSLLENEFDILTPDLRGFGQSTTIESPYTIVDMADDLAGLLDHLGIEKIAMAGHSMGGYVALAFAKKYPQKLSGLGLVSSQAMADSAEGKERRYKTVADVKEKGISIVADLMTPKLSADIRVKNFVRGVIEKQSKFAVTGALKAMAEREDMSAFLSEFTLPLMLIHGDSDQLIPLERAKEIKSANPSASFLELKGAGHMPMMEFPGQLADGLMFFAG
jgi:pimeloyl-ACP methyl ester carboxylesterase